MHGGRGGKGVGEGSQWNGGMVGQGDPWNQPTIGAAVVDAIAAPVPQPKSYMGSMMKNYFTISINESAVGMREIFQTDKFKLI